MSPPKIPWPPDRDKIPLCPVCQKRFKSGTALWKHIVGVHKGSGVRLQCTVLDCCESFPTPRLLGVHARLCREAAKHAMLPGVGVPSPDPDVVPIVDPVPVVDLVVVPVVDPVVNPVAGGVEVSASPSFSGEGVPSPNPVVDPVVDPGVNPVDPVVIPVVDPVVGGASPPTLSPPPPIPSPIFASCGREVLPPASSLGQDPMSPDGSIDSVVDAPPPILSPTPPHTPLSRRPLPQGEADLDELAEFTREWKEKVEGSIAVSWEAFENVVDEFVSASREEAKDRMVAQTRRTRGPDPPPNMDHLHRRPPPGVSYDAREASRLQKLYNNSRRRAFRVVTAPNSSRFTGGKEVCEGHFRRLNDQQELQLGHVRNIYDRAFPRAPEGGRTSAGLLEQITPEEVAKRLGRAENTAPGSDKLEYKHLKLVDPQGEVLAAVYSHCLKVGKVPSAWKRGHTILIHKRGNTTDPANFRPISLLSTTYKLFSGILAARMNVWIGKHDILSQAQKGFVPKVEGCMEHSFLVGECLSNAKATGKKLYVAWLDLANAFGSVPHESLEASWEAVGLPSEFRGLLRGLYAGASSSYQTPEGATDPIPFLRGVRQGDPLSPVLFNLAMEGLIDAVSGCSSPFLARGHPTSVCALADDLTLFSATSEGLQNRLNLVSGAASSLGLTFRPSKCRTLAMVQRREEVEAIFRMGDNTVPTVAQDEQHTYLGVPQGFGYAKESTEGVVANMVREIKLIGASLLTPWQKLDAYKTFLQPRLQYLMRAGEVRKRELKALRKAVIAFGRALCNLPGRSSVSYFFSSKSDGGLGLLDPRKEPDVLTLVQATRMLVSQDTSVAGIALAGLRSHAQKLTVGALTSEAISDYMSGKASSLSKHSGYRDLWSRARKAAASLGVKVEFGGTETKVDQVSIVISKDGRPTINLAPNSAIHPLRSLVHRKHADKLRSLKSQGRTFPGQDKYDKYGNSSHWLTTGLGLRFCDWRFIHKARLNLHHTRAARMWLQDVETKCRRCGEREETLAHVINHCHPLMIPIRRRHNTIVDRLVAALPLEVRDSILLDQSGRVGPTNLKPDIIVEEEDRVSIVDVAVPFEGTEEALKEAAERKTAKYQEVKEAYEVDCPTKTVAILPFIIGALGSWYDPNEATLSALGVARGYRKLLRKFCVSSAISGSRDVYVEHATGVRQY